MAQDWPEDLPAGGGDTLVVAGVEGCLECLSSDEAEKWLETDLKDAILEFQDEYDGQAGLVFWVPSGKNRINMNGATEEYFWKHRSGSTTKDIHIGRLLWAGAEDEIERLLDTEDANADYDGNAGSAFIIQGSVDGFSILPGQRITHPDFGDGVIVSIADDAISVSFCFR